MFILIECHGGAQYAHIVADENGNNIVFDDIDSASIYGEENCQAAIVVHIKFPWSLV